MDKTPQRMQHLEVDQVRSGHRIVVESCTNAPGPGGPPVSAVTSTLASVTLTVLPNDVDDLLEGERAATALPLELSVDLVEDLGVRRVGCVLDELGQQVLLQRLVGLGGPPRSTAWVSSGTCLIWIVAISPR